jgi:DNA-binding NarL/FixJ family response regulator
MESLKEGRGASLEVLVSDADEITARLLAADLRRQQQFQVSECPADLSQVVRSIADNRPPVFLLGMRARDPIAEMLAFLREVQGEFPWIRTILLSEENGRDLVSEVFRAGAKGFFDRSSYDPALLCRCIQCVASGQIWANSDQLSFVLDAFTGTPARQNSRGLESLTPREGEVAQLVSDGLSNGEAADALGLSIHTVKNYLFSIFDKTGVSSRAELMLYLLSQNAQPRKTVSPPTSRRPRVDLNRTSRGVALPSFSNSPKRAS